MVEGALVELLELELCGHSFSRTGVYIIIRECVIL